MSATQKSEATIKLAANNWVPEGEDVWKFDFDPVELKRKYLSERDRRLRGEFQDQYIVVGEGKGAKFAHWLEDPWAKPEEREPLNINIEVLVMGAGFSGILTASKLKDAGITDFKIIDKASDFGGTWYWNRYPGAACDSEAYCYLPYLEETGYMPSHKYVPGYEIRQHCVRLAKHWNLYDYAIWGTQAKELRWDEDAKVWKIPTDRGDTITAKFVVSCGGPINCPHLPDVPGIDSFKGHEFHTSRWDYQYCGGSPDGDFNMTGLKDKRVAVIGTGATGVQCIPYVGECAKELYVFQRTPSAVDVRNNTPTDPDWWKSLPKNWQRDRDDAFQIGSMGQDADIALDDGFSLSLLSWWSLVRRQVKNGEHPEYSIPELLQLADFRHMNRLRKRIDDTVKDKATAEILKPWYNLFCKRPVYSDTFLETFNRPNVHLIDTADFKGIERITEKGVVVNGKEYEVDVIIWASGFETPGAKVNYKVYGRGGLTREEKFAKEGIATLFGIMTSEFPNMVYYAHAQGAVSVNFPSIYTYYAEFTAHLISEMVKKNVTTFEVTKEAENAWADECQKLSRANPQFQAECTPGYYNSEGNIERLKLLSRAAAYGPGAVAYHKKLIEWMEKGTFDGIEIKA